MPALRKAFADYLHLNETDIVLPENSHLIPAWGTALTTEYENTTRLSDVIQTLRSGILSDKKPAGGLTPLFSDDKDYENGRHASTGTISSANPSAAVRRQ